MTSSVRDFKYVINLIKTYPYILMITGAMGRSQKDSLSGFWVRF